MITANDIGWGRYSNFEGPFYRGKTRYEIPDNPEFWDKVLAVFTSTEGGRFESLNMYDRCILSLGLVQFCNVAPMYAVDRMIAQCASSDKEKLDACISMMPAKPTFENGKWAVNGDVVDTKEKQQKLFLGTNGQRGSWDEKSKAYAKENAAVMASIFLDPEFQQAQIEYIKPKLTQWLLKHGKAIIFSRPDEDGWWGALKAAFISFSGNIPAVADKYIKIAADKPEWAAANDETKCILALKTLVFESGITIWPHRYNAIRKTVEKLFGVDLPDFAEDLKAWNLKIGHEYFRTTEEVQVALDYLGYDLGPAGVDGKFGNKTSAALKKFETDNGLEPDGIIDPISSQRLYEEMRNVDSNNEVLGRLIKLSDALMKEGPKDISEILSEIQSYYE